MNTALIQFGAEGSASGIGALGVDGKAFIIQLITFLLALWVLKRFAFKPIMKVMDDRRRTIESGVSLGDEMKKQHAELEQEIAKQLQEARKQADGIIASSEEAARDATAATEAKAQKKADGILRAAEDRIAQETVRARKQLEGELVGLISDATEAIIGEKVDATKDAQLIDRALKGQKA